MSLRAQIHAALEDVTPPAPHLQRRVASYVTADDRDRVVYLRRRRAGWTKPLRGSLALVAAALIVVLMAGLVIGGRLIAESNSLRRTTPGVDSAKQQLTELEARALSLPVLQPGDPCNRGPFATDNSALGSGPMYAYRGSAPTATSWGAYYTETVYTDEKISGPILVRARDLYQAGSVVFVGQLTSGPVVGTDVLRGTRLTQHPEVALDEGHAPPVIDNPPATHHAYVWQFKWGFASDSSGRVGWQIDAQGFSEMFLAC